jgi:hypothetical protein
MEAYRNPFAPGAGSQPPELAGRDQIIADAEIALKRTILGKHHQSQILLGLRGTGKTVLLNKIETLAAKAGHLTSFVEAPEDRKLAELLYPKIFQVLRALSLTEKAKSAVHEAWKALRGFASVFRIEVGDISIAVDAEPGVADSGNLEFDLGDLFIRIGEAAAQAGKAWTLLIDEIQYLSSAELSALTVAIHRLNQKRLPVIFFGAGLPQSAALLGDAKSYAERLFTYPPVSSLDRTAAFAAIRNPVQEEDEKIDDDALELIFEQTRGYPFFLQEWGFQAWNIALSSPIAAPDIEKAGKAALRRLDEGFFKTRFDRLTPKERQYVIAMATLGDGPDYRSADVAVLLGENAQSLGPCRAKIIRKGMIYSPSYGDIAFTVPMFAHYLQRKYLAKP